MNWRDLYEQRSLWMMIQRRRVFPTRMQRVYAAVIPWRYWWN